MENRPKAYNIASISIDSKGIWHIAYLGEHPGQGGMEFGPGNIGGTSLRDLLKAVGKRLSGCKKEYLRQIRAIEENTNVQPKENEQVPEIMGA